MNIEIPLVKGLGSPDPSSASALLDSLSKNVIGNVPWPEYNYKPDVSFAISYTEECILLKYYVRENAFKAVYNLSNDPVYKDSCVEFFIALDDDNGYYNFEFNSIGTCLASYGKERSDRKSLPAGVIEKIKYQSFINAENSPEKVTNWEITLVIPFTAFHAHNVTSLQNRGCRANFYKCGDDLPNAHFLTWNNITSQAPDFHLPQFFGRIKFI